MAARHLLAVRLKRPRLTGKPAVSPSGEITAVAGYDVRSPTARSVRPGLWPAAGEVVRMCAQRRTSAPNEIYRGKQGVINADKALTSSPA